MPESTERKRRLAPTFAGAATVGSLYPQPGCTQHRSDRIRQALFPRMLRSSFGLRNWTGQIAASGSYLHSFCYPLSRLPKKFHFSHGNQRGKNGGHCKRDSKLLRFQDTLSLPTCRISFIIYSDEEKISLIPVHLFLPSPSWASRSITMRTESPTKTVPSVSMPPTKGAWLFRIVFKFQRRLSPSSPSLWKMRQGLPVPFVLHIQTVHRPRNIRTIKHL